MKEIFTTKGTGSHDIYVTRPVEDLAEFMQKAKELPPELQSEVLQVKLVDATICFDDALRIAMDTKRKEILARHPYKIFLGSDGRWKTSVNDSSAKSGRRVVAKATRTKLEDYVVDLYENGGKPEDTKRYSVEAVFESWISLALRNRDIEKSTSDRYRTDYNFFFAETDIINKDIRYVTEKEIIRFVKDIPNRKVITKKSFNNAKTILNGIFKHAKSELDLECISISYTLKDIDIPDKKFQKKIVKDEEEVFSDEEATMLANYILDNYLKRAEKSTRDLGILFALATGLRCGELCTLKKTDRVNNLLYIQRTEVKYKDKTTKNKMVYEVREFPKTSASMDSIILSQSAQAIWKLILTENLKNGVNDEYLFFEKKNGRLKEYFFAKRIRQICKVLGIPIRSMHKLRKTYASQLLANSVEEKIVQHQLRHKDANTTHLIYEKAVRGKEYQEHQLNEKDFLANRLG